MSVPEFKPDAKLREEVLKDDVIFLGTEDIAHKHTQTLLKAEEYYHLVLETLCGKQVWAILDSLAAVEEELKSRSKLKLDNYQQVKASMFTQLEKEYRHGT